MSRITALLTVALCLAAAAAASASGGPPAFNADPVQHGKVDAHGSSAAGRLHRNTVQLLLWHNGAVMTSAAVTSIFWGPSWGSATFTGDKKSGLNTFYGGIGGSNYMGTNTEYTGTNGQVSRNVSNGGSITDLSATSSGAPSTNAVLAVVARNISNPVPNGYYAVYSDQPRGNAGYCAWHSYGTINNVPVQFAFFFNLDGDPGCDPGDTSGLHSQGLAALANVSGHELSEAVTDPRSGGWYDRSGAENADKCAWTFGSLVSFGGTSWKIQGNFSNAAANARAGYDHAGCVNGN